jgi:hypothetical protein
MVKKYNNGIVHAWDRLKTKTRLTGSYQTSHKCCDFFSSYLTQKKKEKVSWWKGRK